jgi:hypothetical protein
MEFSNSGTDRYVDIVGIFTASLRLMTFLWPFILFSFVKLR